jgi:acyl carrier protein
MNQEIILNKIINILNDITDKDNSGITPDSPTSEIQGWDSITHIEFIISIENEYNIKFTSSEMVDFKNMNDICKIIQRKGV